MSSAKTVIFVVLLLAVSVLQILRSASVESTSLWLLLPPTLLQTGSKNRLYCSAVRLFSIPNALGC